MLADPEDVEADLVGELDLLDQVAQPPLGADQRAVAGLRGQLREGVDAEFHGDDPRSAKMPALMVGERTADGMAALTLESAAAGGLVATFVPEAGMICCSLRAGGEELLGPRGGLAKYVGSRSAMAIPSLHPWANRLGASRFEVAGREVDLDRPGLSLKRDGAGLPMHGLLTAIGGWTVEHHL